MKHLLTAIVIAFASFSALAADSDDYHFQIVAQTGQVYSSLGNPAINDIGVIVFNGYQKAPIGNSTFFAGVFSPQGRVFQGNGFTPSCLGSLSINDRGQIAFVEDGKISPTQPFVSGIYEANISGGAVTTIAAPGAVVNGVQFVENICVDGSNNGGGAFAFDNSGRIAFIQTGGYYKYTTDRGLVKIDTKKIDGESLTNIQLVSGDSERLLFEGDASSFQGIFARDYSLLKTGEPIGDHDHDGDDVRLKTIVPGMAAASTDGKLAVVGTYGEAGQNYALVTQYSVVAKTGQRISGKTLARGLNPFDSSPAVNNRGEVIFLGLFGSGKAPNDEAITSGDEIVIAVGGSIAGQTVTALGPPVLNDYGVIAFLASLSNGTQAIVEATPKYR